MQISLSGRTVLITGGGSGIGKGVAAAVVASGGNAMLAGRNADKLAAAADEIKAAAGEGAGQVNYEPADITDEDEAARLVAATTAWHGRLDGVVHSAGGSETIGPLTQIDSAAWRNTVDLNINGTMYVLKHAAREMVRGGGGSFVGISSIASSNTHRWFGAYGPSKAALDHLLMVAADELGPSSVRVNGIRPGLTRTGHGRPDYRHSRDSARTTASARRCPEWLRSTTSRTSRYSCSATRPASSPARSSTSTVGTGSGAAPTCRECSSRSSVPTGCAASSPTSTFRPAEP